MRSCGRPPSYSASLLESDSCGSDRASLSGWKSAPACAVGSYPVWLRKRQCRCSRPESAARDDPSSNDRHVLIYIVKGFTDEDFLAANALANAQLQQRAGHFLPERMEVTRARSSDASTSSCRSSRSYGGRRCSTWSKWTHHSNL